MREKISASTVNLQSIGVYLPSERASNLACTEKFGVTRFFLEEKLGVVERAVKKKRRNNQRSLPQRIPIVARGAPHRPATDPTDRSRYPKSRYENSLYSRHRTSETRGQ